VKRFFEKVLMIIGGLTLIGMIYGAGIGIYVWKKKKVIEPNTVLEISLERNFPEYVPEDRIGRAIMGRSSTLQDLIETLDAASKDDRVVGLIAKAGEAGMGFAQIQEIREAVANFRKSGKPAYAYSDTFGEFGAGNRSYYLASAFEKIYLQPSGDVGLSGLMFETQFIKGTLDKLGLVPRMGQRMEYKNAVNTFTQTQYTAPHKEALQAVMKSLFEQMVKDIAADRKMTSEEVRTLADQGVFLGKEALDAKLVDNLGYRDEAYRDIRKRAGIGVNLITVSEYSSRAEEHYQDKGDAIALIYGVGGVRRGKSTYNSLSGSVSMGSDTVASAFRSAVEDKDVKAILFRVDSPGGSYIASDTIWREVIRAKEAKKPVIVSMGNVAGSGGYFIAMAADKIVAQPATITGSIGVFAGKFLTRGLMEKIGVSTDEVHTSQNSTLWTASQDYTPAQWKRIQSALDRIYEDFTDKAAQGRNLPKDMVMKVAKGRIWTGQDAKDNGLVDELGGFNTALRLAKKAANLPEDVKVRLKLYPEKKSFIDIVLNRESDIGDESDEDSMTKVIEEIQPIVRAVKALGIAEEPGVLAVPESEMFQ